MDMNSLEPDDDSELESLAKLSTTLKIASKKLDKNDVRYLVKMYYQLQNYRIKAGNQVAIAKKEGKEINEFIIWISKTTEKLEGVVKKGLDIYSMEHEVTRWMRSICGIGPVLASGLYAHINIRYHNKERGEVEGCMTPAKIWRYAGLDPTVIWEKNIKRPWNAELKVLCWKIGESFVKTQNNPKSFYGPIYKERRKYDDEKNANHLYAEHAAKQLATKNFKRDTITKQAYLRGELSDGHIYSISKRKVVKLFLCHLWEVWYEIEFKRKPARPWIFALGKHDEAHYIAPPNWPMK